MNNIGFDSIFDNISDLEFEEMLKECGFEYRKVEPGKGGLCINGVKVEPDIFSIDLYEKKYSKINEYSVNNFADDNEFTLDDNTNLVKAA
ncbi:hypothetical protein FDB25_15805 [Clostridium botulinum]|nr:hypothetical protein [Clostridium botulinum]